MRRRLLASAMVLALFPFGGAFHRVMIVEPHIVHSTIVTPNAK